MDASSDGRINHERLIQTHEELTFLVNDLVREGNEIAISTNPLIVRKVIERLLCEAEEFAPEIDLEQEAHDNAALIEACKSVLTDLEAIVESPQGSKGVDPQLLPPGERLAQREIVVAVLEALPNQLTAEQIIAERLPYHDCDQSELHRALSVVIDLGLLELASTGVIIPSSGLLRMNELWEDLCAAI
jgi:hypothetical protein